MERQQRSAPAEKRAPRRDAPERRPAKREEPERVSVGGLRTLGDVAPEGRRAPSRHADDAVSEQAVQTLRSEFERALAMLEKLKAEAAIGAEEKGRDADRKEKVRSIVASLEGMNRFAIAMGLVSPAQSRELYAEAMKRGLYEGWR